MPSVPFLREMAVAFFLQPWYLESSVQAVIMFSTFPDVSAQKSA